MGGHKNHQISSAQKISPSLEECRYNKTLIYGIIFVFAFILYGNTISYDYTYDDDIVITGNKFTKKGLAGVKDILRYDTFRGRFGNEKIVAGGRYRPLSLVTYAIEVELFGQNPHVAHFTNVLLYAFTGCLIFAVLARLFAVYPFRRWYFSIPFLVSIFFIAHPIHTEVIASIKGRDDIMAFLGSLVTLWLILRHLDTNKAKYKIWSAIAFFLAMLSKENSVTFLLLVPLSVYYFTDHSTKRNILSLIPAGISLILFLIIRRLVLGEFETEIYPNLLNDPFLHASIADRYATISYTLGLYIKLLLFPHPLTYDYYPYHIPIIKWTDPRAIIPLISYAGIMVYALIGLKKKWVVSYGLWFYLIPLSIVSNLFFSIGAFMGERFIYFSSLGFCLIIGYLLLYNLPRYFKNERAYYVLLSVIILTKLSLYSFKTITRNTVWKNNFTLFSTDVETSANSAQSNLLYAAQLIQKTFVTTDPNLLEKYYELAIKHLKKTLEIHPESPNAYDILGNIYLSPKYKVDYETALNYLQKSFDINPNFFHVSQSLGKLYLVYKKDPKKAIFYLEQSIKTHPKNASAYEDMGNAYMQLGDEAKAREYFDKAAALRNK